MIHRSKLRYLILVLFVLAVALPGYGQVDYSTATLKGTVLDAQEAAVRGATVTVMNPSTGISKTVKTGGDGTYQVPALAPGTYEVEVEAPGFQKSIAKSVLLTVGQFVIYDFHLKLGSISEVVEVTMEAPLIQVEQTQQANTINEAQVENLPNISRSFTASVFTLPGVSSSAAPRVQFPTGNAFGTSGFSIGGSNGRTNLVSMDGGENDSGAGGLRTANVPLESVQEFQVNRNSFNAEFGFTAGSTVNVVTKSGTNRFHGSGFIFFRDQHTQARNYFDTDPQQSFNQNIDSGATLGGPIVKDKLFFFTAYEFRKGDVARFRRLLADPAAQGITGQTSGYNSLTDTCPAPVTQLCYQAQLANSTFQTLRTLAANLISPTNTTQSLNLVTNLANQKKVLDLLTPNEGTFDDPNRFHNWVTRVDYQPTTKDSISFRFLLEHQDSSTIGAANPGNINQSDRSTLFQRDYDLVANWYHAFTPQVANHLLVQVVPRSRADLKPNPANIMAELNVGNFGTFGQSFGVPYLSLQDRFQYEDSLTWTKASHSFKFGASYRPVNYTTTNGLWSPGQFGFPKGSVALSNSRFVPTAQAAADLRTFNTARGYCAQPTPACVPPASTNLSELQEFALGLPSTFRQAFGNPTWHDWAHYLGIYAQDSWKVSRRLTLDFGGRIDYDVEPSPIPHNVYLSPRLGIAWDPFGNHKTVIRAGGGVFYSPVTYVIPVYTNITNDDGKHMSQSARSLATGAAQIWSQGLQSGHLPFGQLTAADLASIAPPFGPIVVRQGLPGRVIFEAQPDYKNPYGIQASTSIARELVRDLSVEVGYQMYKGVHLPFDRETNYKETGVVDPFIGPIYSAIDPTIVQKNTYSSTGNSIYHGMTASLTKRWSNHLQFQTNYTFSKAIDDTTDFSSGIAAFRPTRLNLERGISAYDITHNFVANAVYSSPFQAGQGHNILSRVLADMSISPILFLRSGVPFAIRVPSLGGAAGNGTVAHTAYARPFNAGRNTGTGPAFRSLDMRIAKSLFIRRESGLRFDFIVSGTNLFNHTNFSRVNDIFPADLGTFPFLLNGPYNVTGFKSTNIKTVASTPLAFTEANDARQIQFGLKLAF